MASPGPTFVLVVSVNRGLAFGPRDAAIKIYSMLWYDTKYYTAIQLLFSTVIHHLLFGVRPEMTSFMIASTSTRTAVSWSRWSVECHALGFGQHVTVYFLVSNMTIDKWPDVSYDVKICYIFDFKHWMSKIIERRQQNKHHISITVLSGRLQG